MAKWHKSHTRRDCLTTETFIMLVCLCQGVLCRVPARPSKMTKTFLRTQPISALQLRITFFGGRYLSVFWSWGSNIEFQAFLSCFWLSLKQAMSNLNEPLWCERDLLSSSEAPLWAVSCVLSVSRIQLRPVVLNELISAVMRRGDLRSALSLTSPLSLQPPSIPRLFKPPPPPNTKPPWPQGSRNVSLKILLMLELVEWMIWGQRYVCC